MLKILKRIVQDVTTANTLLEALTILVRRVSKAVAAEAVSVYLIDNKNAEYVLIATEGLNQKAQSKVRVGLDSGLIGLVGRREEPINIEDAPSHPDFHHNPLIGEEHLRAFLGVPIIQHRKLYGVLIVQQSEKREFDDAEEAFLITLAAQLGGIIAQADATGELQQLTQPALCGNEKSDSTPTALAGIGSVPGVAIGTAVVVYPPSLSKICCRCKRISAGCSSSSISLNTRLALANEILRIIHFTRGKLVEFILKVSKPMAINKITAKGSLAISPQILTSTPAACPPSTMRIRVCNSAG